VTGDPQSGTKGAFPLFLRLAAIYANASAALVLPGEEDRSASQDARRHDHSGAPTTAAGASALLAAASADTTADPFGAGQAPLRRQELDDGNYCYLWHYHWLYYYCSDLLDVRHSPRQAE
jgi:hypothetical protein